MGALLGDCLGAPFEGDPLSRGALKVVQNYFDKLEEPIVKGSAATATIKSMFVYCRFVRAVQTVHRRYGDDKICG